MTVGDTSEVPEHQPAVVGRKGGLVPVGQWLHLAASARRKVSFSTHAETRSCAPPARLEDACLGAGIFAIARLPPGSNRRRGGISVGEGGVTGSKADATDWSRGRGMQAKIETGQRGGGATRGCWLEYCLCKR